MGELWNGKQCNAEVGDNYCIELGRSATYLTQPPEVITAKEAKDAAYLMNQAKRYTEDIAEIELPYELLDAETRTLLGRQPQPDEIIVLYADRNSGGQTHVIERDTPNLTPAECKQHAVELDKAMAKEWASWNEHASFEPRLRSKANNVIDARWVHKWKYVDGKKIIKSRLCVRGFKDVQGKSVTTSASTASRWGQRMVVSAAVQHGWEVSLADVSTAFLRGMDFDELCKYTGEEKREVCFNHSKGS